MKDLSIGDRRSLPRDDALTRSIRLHMIAAAAVIVVLVGGGGGWAVMTEIAGAVIAPGTIVVESEVKQVQHREGGIVKEILVNDGDEVAAGDLLIRLDDTSAWTRHSIIINQLAELKARSTRLAAERDGKEHITFPPRAEGKKPRDLAAIELRQALLMRARRGSLGRRKGQLEDQILQLEQQIGGLRAQQEAKRLELDVLEEEFAGVKELYEKRLATMNRFTSLKRDKTKLEGEHSELTSKIAGLKEAISERRMQILQIEEDDRAEILKELEDASSQIAELELKKIAVDDELDRSRIRAPSAGFVHQMTVHTLGGVIHPGDTILKLVPRDDLLVVEAEVAPSDIDQLSAEQSATIRFPGLDHRTTPRLEARVRRIDADLTINEVAQTQFYKVRLTIPKEELGKLSGQKLVPGMPVEAFITTGNRTVFAYLMKPITDQIAHALKEE